MDRRLRSGRTALPTTPTPVPVWAKAALTATEADQLTGLSASSWRRLVEQGHVTRVPHTGRFLIARAEIDRFLTSNVASTAVRELTGEVA